MHTPGQTNFSLQLPNWEINIMPNFAIYKHIKCSILNSSSGLYYSNLSNRLCSHPTSWCRHAAETLLTVFAPVAWKQIAVKSRKWLLTSALLVFFLLLHIQIDMRDTYTGWESRQPGIIFLLKRSPLTALYRAINTSGGRQHAVQLFYNLKP